MAGSPYNISRIPTTLETIGAYTADSFKSLVNTDYKLQLKVK